MPSPINVNPQNYNFTIDQFKTAFAQAKESNGYVYINKQGQLAVRGFWSNLFGIGGIKNSKQETMDALNRTLQNSIGNGIDIFKNTNETTIRKGYGLSAGMMANTFKYAEKIAVNKAKTNLANTLSTMHDEKWSGELDGGNKITLNDDLKQSLINKICNTFKYKSDDFRLNLLKDTMKAINDRFTEGDIQGINKHGYSSRLSNFNLDQRVSLDVKDILDISNTQNNEILIAVKNQYDQNKLQESTNIAINNAKKNLLEKVNNLQVQTWSDKEDGGNKIILDDDLKQKLAARISKRFVNKDDDFRLNLFKDTMKAINDYFNENDIKGIDGHGFSRSLMSFSMETKVSADVKEVLDLTNMRDNKILIAVKTQYDEAHAL